MSDVYVAHVLNAVVMCWPMSIVDPGAFRTFPLVVHHCALSLSFFSLRTVALGGGVISLTALSVFSHCTVGSTGRH